MLAVSNLGCAICCAPHDYDYATYGGVWDRLDRTSGRVASSVDPAPATGARRLVPRERDYSPVSGYRDSGDYDNEDLDGTLPDPSDLRNDSDELDEAIREFEEASGIPAPPASGDPAADGEVTAPDDLEFLTDPVLFDQRLGR